MDSIDLNSTISKHGFSSKTLVSVEEH